MSTKNYKKTDRIKNDYYPTDLKLGELVVDYLADALLYKNRCEELVTLYDPSVGDGNLFNLICDKLKPFYESYCRVQGTFPYPLIRTSVDIDFIDKHGYSSDDVDSTKESSWLKSLNTISQQVVRDLTSFTIVFSNPPYNKNLLPKFIKYGWQYSTVLCYLLPITFLEHCYDRKDFLKNTSDHLQYIIPVHPRCRFRYDTKSKSYQRTVAWYIWNKNFSYAELGIESPFVFK